MKNTNHNSKKNIGGDPIDQALSRVMESMDAEADARNPRLDVPPAEVFKLFVELFEEEINRRESEPECDTE